jgi:hypothetical protein
MSRAASSTPRDSEYAPLSLAAEAEEDPDAAAAAATIHTLLGAGSSSSSRRGGLPRSVSQPAAGGAPPQRPPPTDVSLDVAPSPPGERPAERGLRKLRNYGNVVGKLHANNNRCGKRPLFLSFPYVCPEPVLAK